MWRVDSEVADTDSIILDFRLYDYLTIECVSKFLVSYIMFNLIKGLENINTQIWINDNIISFLYKATYVSGQAWNLLSLLKLFEV